MLLSFLLPVVILSVLFAVLPFAGEGRMFSMPVEPAWFAAEGRRVRWRYVFLVAGVAEFCVVAAPFANGHVGWSLLVMLSGIAGLMLAWSWGWRRTLPHEVQHEIVRTSSLRPRRKGLMLGATWAALLPLVASAALLAARFQRLPAVFANHFNAALVPDHYVHRSVTAVFFPLWMGAAAVALLASILWAILYRSAGIADKGQYASITGRLMVLVTWLVSLETSGAALMPLANGSPAYVSRWLLACSIALAAILLVTAIALVRQRKALSAPQSATQTTHWKAGLVYFNRDDAALFVPKRMGWGYTLNMAKPAAWWMMGAVLVFALLPLLFKLR